MVLEIIGGALGLFKVVPVNEAHVRVMNGKKEMFCSRNGFRPNYWYVPFITRVNKLPLTNISIVVKDIKLNDKNMAKFICDINCFVNISDPTLAAERTQLTATESEYEESLKDTSVDFTAIMQSVGRTVATKQTILEIYQDRETLQNSMKKDIAELFPKWGLELVDLEINDIRDAEESTIIQDIEQKIAAQITADARIKTAQEIRRAAIVEAESIRDAELVKAETDEQWKKRGIERDKAVSIAEQVRDQEVAEQRRIANEKAIEAERRITVGAANINKEAVIQKAEGEASSVKLIAEGDATKVKLTADAEATRIRMTGMSEADIIRAKKVAEAEGTEKLAIAQQKFNDAATNIELIRANKEIGIEYAKSYGLIAENAEISIVTGDSKTLLTGGLLGDIKLGGQEGAALKQFITTGDPEVLEKLRKVLTKPTKEVKHNE